MYISCNIKKTRALKNVTFLFLTLSRMSTHETVIDESHKLREYNMRIQDTRMRSWGVGLWNPSE